MPSEIQSEISEKPKNRLDFRAIFTRMAKRVRDFGIDRKDYSDQVVEQSMKEARQMIEEFISKASDSSLAIWAVNNDSGFNSGSAPGNNGFLVFPAMGRDQWAGNRDLANFANSIAIQELKKRQAKSTEVIKAA